MKKFAFLLLCLPFLASPALAHDCDCPCAKEGKGGMSEPLGTKAKKLPRVQDEPVDKTPDPPPAFDLPRPATKQQQ